MRHPNFSGIYRDRSPYGPGGSGLSAVQRYNPEPTRIAVTPAIVDQDLLDRKRQRICSSLLITPAKQLPLHRRIFSILTSDDMKTILMRLIASDASLCPSVISFSGHTAAALTANGNFDLLCAALKQQSCTGVRVLVFRGVPLDPMQFARLMEAVCLSSITRITFQQCKLLQNHFQGAVSALEHQQQQQQQQLHRLQCIAVCDDALSVHSADGLGKLAFLLRVDRLMAINCQLDPNSLDALCQHWQSAGGAKFLRALHITKNPRLTTAAYNSVLGSSSLSHMSTDGKLSIALRKMLKRNRNPRAHCSSSRARVETPVVVNDVKDEEGSPNEAKRLKRSPLESLSAFRHIFSYESPSIEKLDEQPPKPSQMDVVPQEEEEDPEGHLHLHQPRPMEITE